MSKLSIIEGIGEAYGKKLDEAGISSIEDLLEKSKSPKGRADLANASAISEKLILKWANHADLFRIKGIGGEYAELLEMSGVDTVPELAQRNAKNLHAKMTEINESKNLVRKLPAESQVDDWIKQAAVLPRVIQY